MPRPVQPSPCPNRVRGVCVLTRKRCKTHLCVLLGGAGGQPVLQ